MANERLMKSINKKRTIIILSLLMNANKNSAITNNDIQELLADKGITVERKTVSDDIKILKECGFPILSTGRFKYYYAGSDFTTSELKILINAIESSNFITENKSKTLIDKIAMQGGGSTANELTNKVKYHTVKSENDLICEEIEKLHYAILNGYKITFKYFDYDYKNVKNYRKDGRTYIVNPLHLLFKNEKYYMLSYLDKYKEKNVTHFRIDRMENIQITDEPISYSEMASNFNLSEHMKCTFSMYNGKNENITFEIGTKAIDCIREKFGKDVKFIPINNGKFQVTLTIGLCNQFYGWCSSFGTDLIIKSPENIKTDYKNYLKEIISNY